MSEASTHPGRRLVLLPERLVRRLEPWPREPAVAEHLLTLPNHTPHGELPWERITGGVLWSWEPTRLANVLLSRCPALEWLHSTWAGVEHLPLETIRRRGVTLTNARGVDAGPIAEWVVAVLLSRLKALPRLAQQQARHVWQPVEAQELSGTRVLILGTGRIGRAVAARLAPFGVHLTGIRRRGGRLADFDAVLPTSDLVRVARRCDVMVLALPLTEATRDLVDESVLDRLPDGAGVINVGRGETLDLAALVKHLCAGRLWAALDVLPEEPLPPDARLWETPGLLLSPHSAHSSPEHRRRHLALVRQQIRRYLAGHKLRNRLELD